MHVRIVGTDLPGGGFDNAGRTGEAGYVDIHVGVQRRGEVEQLVAGDADRAEFDLELSPKGDRDATGPYAHGTPGGRFIYLVWVHGPGKEMFRRAKIMLDDIPLEVWRDGATGSGVEAALRLTDGCRGPLCGRVPAEAITWRVPH